MVIWRRPITFSLLSLFWVFVILPVAVMGRRGLRKYSVPGMFVFGDSQVDAGTNEYVPNCTALANFPPYGETYFHKPTGRFTNGRTVVDFIAQALELPLVPPYLKPNVIFKHGANFASAGSGLLTLTNQAERVLPFSTQIRQFSELSARLRGQLGPKHATKLIRNAIYVCVTGSNDIGSAYLGNSTFRNSTSPQAFITLLLEEYQKAILALYKDGGRKFILVGLGPLGCTPNFRLAASSNGACYKPANELAITFNTGLNPLAASLRQSLPRSIIIVNNNYDLIVKLIDHGSEYGFTNTTVACCGAGPFNTAISCGHPVPKNVSYSEVLCPKPSESLFWDGTHPTEYTYYKLFRNIWGGNSSYMEPMNIETLAAL